ncbi:hypothetical protein BD413DRAFT_75834 [Trametes elegans]|nr:hypothetical protein BD413DRAFT_75834 [Trametes elegans]
MWLPNVQMLFGTKKVVVRIPGLPPMYDYEYNPQDFPFPPEMTGDLLAPTYGTLTVADGLSVVTPEPYEPEAVAALRAWYKRDSKEAYVIGPLLASGPQAVAREKGQITQAQVIDPLLDETLRTNGKHSLLYIWFGTIFWPVKNTGTIRAFLDVVTELDIPFILNHASPFAVVPPHVQEKVCSGRSRVELHSKRETLDVRYMTLPNGQPRICWPFGADQAPNASHLAENLDVAYELTEVRSGRGLKPSYRNGNQPRRTVDALRDEARDVLTRAFGEDGAENRGRLLQLGDAGGPRRLVAKRLARFHCRASAHNSASTPSTCSCVNNLDRLASKPELPPLKVVRWHDMSRSYHSPHTLWTIHGQFDVSGRAKDAAENSGIWFATVP